MSAYTIYKELFSPQAVEHAETCHFTDPDAVNLVVAKSNLLQIYDFVEYLSVEQDHARNDLVDSRQDDSIHVENGRKSTATILDTIRSASGRLELIAQYKLNGAITTMGVARLPTANGKAGCDSLLLGFSDAKMSILEWSIEKHSIETVSIHYYEREELKNEFMTDPRAPEIRVDPEQRCAVLNFYGTQLAVLPFGLSNVYDIAVTDIDDYEEHSQLPYSPSYIVDLATVSLPSPIKTVLDITFLSGYHVPTLAILFQTKHTWTSRLSLTRDTAAIAVIELDLSGQKNVTVIYSHYHLPFDSFKLVPMPKPVDGLIILSASAILHISQGSQGIGIAVNSYTEKMTSFPGMIYNPANVELGLALEGANFLTIGGTRCLIFLQNGDWLILQVKLDGSHVVDMNITLLDHSKTTDDNKKSYLRANIPTCVSNVKGGEYFFLGSRAGDALLIKWHYNGDLHSRRYAKITDFSFRVSDYLLNTGPIVDMTVGEIADSKHGLGDASTLPSTELVTCSGVGENGSLCVFQRHIRPNTSFNFTQPDCCAIWSVKCQKSVMNDIKQASHDTDLENTFDKFLVISRSKSTLVLSAGEELQEIEKSDFYIKGPTVAVGTVFDHTEIIQVHQNGLLLLSSEGKHIKSIPVRDSKIVDASISDPYIILTLENRTMLALVADKESHALAFMKIPKVLKNTPVGAAAAFTDVSGIFCNVEEKRAFILQQKKRSERVSPDIKRKSTMNIENTTKKPYAPTRQPAEQEDVDLDMDFLYGGSTEIETKAVNDTTSATIMDVDGNLDEALLYGKNQDEGPHSPINNDQNDKMDEDIAVIPTEMTRTSYWCVVCTLDGTLQFYSLPDFSECFSFSSIEDLPSLLLDDKAQGTLSEAYSNMPLRATNNVIREMLLTNIGKERMDPHLVIQTTNDNVVIYKAFSYLPPESDSTTNVHSARRLALRFTRVYHECVPIRSPFQSEEETKPTDEDKAQFEDGMIAFESLKPKRKYLFSFADVDGYAGVFIAGRQPAWLMSSCKSFVRYHPMKIPDEAVGFSQFHNVNCQHGFITVDAKSNVSLNQLQTDGICYDMDWITQKTCVGQTVHKIAYHPTMHVYSVLVSSPEDYQPVDADKAPEEVEARPPGLFLPQIERFSLILVSPVTWETVDRFELEQYEQGITLDCITLESDQTSSGVNHFTTVGTGFLRGEDTVLRGNIYIIDIIEVVPDPDNPQKKHRFKKVLVENVKGAVTSICEIRNHLACYIGSRVNQVRIYRFEDLENLEQVAFYDMQIYVTSMCSIKNYILVGDAQKSIWFLAFQVFPPKLKLLGKDYQSLGVASLNYLIDDRSLYFLVGDMDENVNIFQFAPHNLMSQEGKRLIRRGDFHMGSQIQTFVRLPQLNVGTNGVSYGRRQFCVCGSFNGSISMIYPVSEKTFKRLNGLYGQLVNGMQQIAGLNPKAFRLIKGYNQRVSSNRIKAVLDGDIVFGFTNLALDAQRDTTKHIGSTVDRIMDDLIDIETSINYF